MRQIDSMMSGEKNVNNNLSKMDKNNKQTKTKLCTKCGAVDNTFWDDNKVIYFVNWYLKLHKLNFRYALENKTIIDSFKNGDDVSKWQQKKTIKDPNKMTVGSQYRITEPVYDDYEEGLQPETNLVEVIKKTRYGVVLRDLKYGFTYGRTFQHLLEYEIEDVLKT